MNPSILVIGSSNTDMVIQADHIPSPGETILGGSFFMNPGGKGANQAVAATRLGGNVTLVTKLGLDLFGKQAIENFRREGVITDYIISTGDHPSGVALITVDKKGENSIVVASGANAALMPADLMSAMTSIQHASIILMQLEIPIETVEFIAREVKLQSAIIILNPAPATELPLSLLDKISIITPNEKEAEALAGILVSDEASIRKAAEIIKAKGPRTVIITLGEKGAYLLSDAGGEFIPAPKVKAIDTTAAGDIFCGALAVSLSQNMSLRDAVHFAIAASALSVTRLGAQASAPYRAEVDDFIAQSKQKTVGSFSR